MANFTFIRARAPLLSPSGLLLLCVLLYIVHCIFSYRKLRKFKGPRTVGYSKIWLLRCVTSGKMHHKFIEISRKYGSTARIGPQTLLTCDIELIRRMNAPRSSYKRSDWYAGSRFVPNKDSLLSEMNEARHKALRAAMTSAYNSKEHGRLEESIDTQLGSLMNLIKSKYLSVPSSTPILMDWGTKASFFTIDSIADFAFSEPVGDLTEDADNYGFLSNIETSLPIMSVFTCYTWMTKLLQMRGISQLIAPKTDEPTGFGRIIGLTRDIVGRRFGPTKIVRHDMLGSFIEHGLSQSEAEMSMVLQIVAGSDPVATVLRVAVLYISTRPLVLSTLTAELHKHGLKPDRPITSIIRADEARKLPYLVACVKEVLRIHPPIVGLLEKQVGPEGDTLPDGRFIPGNTKIGVSIWAVERDKKIFGEDADLFWPERWLEGTVEVEARKKMDKSLDMVFGWGRYTCMGKEIAITQCLKVIAELFSRFDIEILNPEKPWHSVAYGIFCQHNQWVRVTARKA